MQAEHYDVLIVGAGLSGIAAAHHLQTRCPGKRYAILERRAQLGGTWDLFRYPGIRSDSDMYTLGFSFRPWQDPQAIADGPSILSYLRDTATETGIDRRIVFGHELECARWSSQDGRWTLEVRQPESGLRKRYTCDFLWACTGYYRYDQGYTPRFAGMHQFRGQLVHPQHWSDDIRYDGKRVVVIGSGATAMTLVPELAKRAAHVTMLQRSPTYVICMPRKDRLAEWLKQRLPAQRAYALIRWKNVLLGIGFYEFSRHYPDRARRFLVGKVRSALGDGFDTNTHFEPRYQPWDQRLCLLPDGDLLQAIRAGRVSVVTDALERFTEHGLALQSGRSLEADLVVTATGLELQFLGGASMQVDGATVDPARTMMYRGTMLGGVPNAAVSVGYTNASWTLKCELSCEYVCRLLNYMDAHGYSRCCPRLDPTVPPHPLIDLTAGYVQRARQLLPVQGARSPWRLHQNYVLDRMVLRYRRVDEAAMAFS